MSQAAFESVALGAGLVIGVWMLVAWGRRLGRSRHARAVNAHAQWGERAADDLLMAAGYHIEARQVRAWWWPSIDGQPIETELRVDRIVCKDGRRLVAEVKTGAEARELSTAATRRQLLEYCVALEVDGVLLIAPERGLVSEIEFPGVGSARALPQPAPSTAAPIRSVRAIVVALLVGGVLGHVW